MSMSHVCGHFHESFAIKYWANPQRLVLAMNSGRLIDDRALAFVQQCQPETASTLSNSLIIDGYPVLAEAMPL
jgi:hypothetical protein